jgi:murein DD-endopeptidase
MRIHAFLLVWLSAAAPVATYRSIPLHIDARPSPTAVLADDAQRYLVYRVYLTNWSDHELRLRAFDVLDAANGELLVRYGPEQLADPRRQRATFWISGEPGDANRTIAAGRSATVAVHLALPATMPAPRSLRHRMTFEPHPSLRMRTDSGAVTEALIAETEVLPLDPRTPPVLEAPLRGGDWICANGPALDNSHAAIYPFRDSRMRVPQRFGCDFKKVDAEGNSLPNPFPDIITNTMFYGYGAEVLAVADGVITTVVDGIPETIPRADGRTEMPVPFINANGSGNWVALDIGNGRYAFYAHLQPGSRREAEADGRRGNGAAKHAPARERGAGVRPLMTSIRPEVIISASHLLQRIGG